MAINTQADQAIESPTSQDQLLESASNFVDAADFVIKHVLSGLCGPETDEVVLEKLVTVCERVVDYLRRIQTVVVDTADMAKRPSTEHLKTVVIQISAINMRILQGSSEVLLDLQRSAPTFGTRWLYILKEAAGMIRRVLPEYRETGETHEVRCGQTLGAMKSGLSGSAGLASLRWRTRLVRAFYPISPKPKPYTVKESYTLSDGIL
jgi:hypothetical protein